MAKKTNRNSKKEIKKDKDFLKEMLERLEKAPNDLVEYNYLEQMINDWISELEEHLT